MLIKFGSKSLSILAPAGSCFPSSRGICVLQGMWELQHKTNGNINIHEQVFSSTLCVCLVWDVFIFSAERPKTQCEIHRESLVGGSEYGPRGARPPVGQYVPTCDEYGAYEPIQCHGSSGYCWCVDHNGQEIPGTRSGPGSRPMCE